ncbi:phospholipid scramblase 2-like isoform X2 [Ornithodoros turicata]|uniref:phospholipid scramblase 2-like isoform X2 n=1 Tax=Ornithodoros turicata TaxID=34597 RepID=UPI003139E942
MACAKKCAITSEPRMIQRQTDLNDLTQAKEVKIILVEERSAWRFIVQDSRNNDLFTVYKACHKCEEGLIGLSSASFTACMKRMDSVVVMKFERPLRLQSGLKGYFCCCLGQEMEIEAPPGRRISSISEDYNILGTSLTIYDAKGKAALKILGSTSPPFLCLAKFPTVLKVQTLPGTVVGEIRIEEFITISFHPNLDVYIKGCLIGCAILVRFMFYVDGCASGCFQLLKLTRPWDVFR